MTKKRQSRKPKRGRPKKVRGVRQELVTKAVPVDTQDNEGMREFVREASEVKQMTAMAGWGILERDIKLYRERLVAKLAYVSPERPEFYEARLIFLAADKLLSMVNDYEFNRDKMIELLNKLDNPGLEITLDVDNE